jgi:peptidoglycan/LPS O-acetylase OafA/YrhL
VQRDPMAYRPEIDGLRALAVVPVILFHAGIDLFGAGFLGVDIFFVISGFLITGLILHERGRGTFSLANFYARRARRILPALALVLVACIPAALLLMTAAQEADFFRSFVATILFASNVHLASTSGYFDAAAELRPLLHTWSLAVEEQYYLAFPLLLIAWRLDTRRLVMVIAAIAAASLALAEYGWRWNPTANFYLTAARAWELLLGALCAFMARSMTHARWWPRGVAKEALAGAGLAGLLTSLALFTRAMPTPSAWCLAPTGAAALVLLFGDRETVVGRLLSTRVLTAIGLVSYSAYLWHQPLFAFARLASLDAPSRGVMLALVAATFVLAAISWRWVEQPARRSRSWPASRVLRIALACSAGLALTGVTASVALPSTAPALPARVSSAFQPPPRARECFDIAQAHRLPTGWYCEINPQAEDAPSFVLYGDSHSLQMLETFEAAARATGRRGIFAGFSGCAPLPGTVALARTDQRLHDCGALNQRVFRWAAEHRVRDLYLVAKWSYYTNPWTDGWLNAIGLDAHDPRTLEASRHAFTVGARQAAALSRAAGVRLHVIAQAPQQRYAPATVYEKVFARGRLHDAQLRAFSVSVAEHEALQAFPNEVWRGLAGQGLLDFVDLTPRLCDADRCPIGTASMSYYEDISHLSADGAARLLPAIGSLLSRGTPS